MSERERRNLEQFEKERAYNRDYMRRYRVEHPDRVQESRIRSAITLLERSGYKVTKEDPA